MDTQNNQNPSNIQNKVPEPPPLEINVRTMETDTKQFKEAGGELSEIGAKKVFIPKAEEQPKQEAGINVSGYSGPEKPIFQTSEVASFPQEQRTSINVGEGSSGKLKSILLVVGVAVGAAVLGFLGYYVVFPLFFK